MADAFHQVAVGGDDPGAVVDQGFAEARRQHPLGQRHADRGGDALAERAGGGLDPGVLAVFRVAGGGGVELPEFLEVLDAHAGLAGQVQQGIEQHGAVAGGQHEAVPVRPAGIGRVVLQEAGEEDGRDIGHAHRHAGVAGLRLFDRIDREGADGVGHAALLRRGTSEQEGLGDLGRGRLRARLGIGFGASQGGMDLVRGGASRAPTL